MLDELKFWLKVYAVLEKTVLIILFNSPLARLEAPVKATRENDIKS